jgi:hypothetical protein
LPFFVCDANVSTSGWGTAVPVHLLVGIRPALLTRSPRDVAVELLALSKMNWNHARLDGRLPITLRTAEQVTKVLRFTDPGRAIATRYAQYM